MGKNSNVAETHKEKRERLARNYFEQRRQTDKTVDDWAKRGRYSEEEKTKARERLYSNLQEELSLEEGYQEARKAHRAEHKARLEEKRAKENKEQLQREYEEQKQKLQEFYEGKIAKADKNIENKSEAYEEAQINYRGEVKETEVKDELYGKKDEILEDLKENKGVVVEENVDYMGYKGKKVHINLPKIEGKFDGFKFEYFVSNESVLKRDFENNPELEKKSYSMKDVGGLLGAMNKYMQVMGVETDLDMDYENDLKSWKTDNYRCDAGDCLKQITGLNYLYWLRDKNVDSKKNLRAAWNCYDDFCNFRRSGSDYSDANLFLRLS